MGIRALRIYEYWVECDECGREEVYHTHDQDNGVYVHSIASAKRASGYHYCGEKLLCPICYENYVFDKTHKKRR